MVAPSPKLDCEGRGSVEAAAGEAPEAVGGVADTDAGDCVSITKKAARFVLETVVDEACGRHVDRLVHSVRVSGNRELRANVALAIGVLSVGTGRGQGRGKVLLGARAF